MEVLEKMLEVPLDEMIDEQTQEMFLRRFSNTLGELESCPTREGRRHIIGRAFKSMFVLGRWSTMILMLVNTLDVWF